ncbi:MAG: hypothetical protein Kow0069_11290 [Promethearchaeota archaeon]
MSRDKIEPLLANLLDSIAELEGVIATNLDGEVIVGQNITEIDLGAVGKSIADLIKAGHVLGQNCGKGEGSDLQFTFKEGFAQAVWNERIVLIALTGSDGRNSLGLILRSLRTLLTQI